ncbi:lysine-rich arabinogalactan protein 19-like [Humulus lupulus]|uniref:lysine-rich arabinogalactan protein 19-like n=1 Tax=Humulus lupulus TaxID=3486 RepID=UPI002B4012D8|nr:lysine-rich arabinogalactan protein 19-like [Humulus lupulus]
MVIQSALLASMIDIEKSVKQLVIEANLRLLDLLAPHQDVRESTAGSATCTEIPEQQPDVSQPPPRRATGVAINDPTGAPRPTTTPAPLGKGKKKATEPILESSDENDMDSENVFDMYCASEAPEAPASKKKSSRRHQEESSKVPPAKKSRIADPPANGPSKNATPPPSPLKKQNTPAPVGSTPSPPAPTDQTQQVAPASTGGDISSPALRSAKDRMAKILKHERCQEAMAGIEMMDVNQILTRALNELASEMLTVTAGQLHSGAITKQTRTSEQQHAEELKAAEAKYAEQLEVAQKTNAVLLKEKNKLAEELREKQTALDKAIEQRDQFKESDRVNYREAKKLEDDLLASRQETTTLDGWIKKLEKANASNLESTQPTGRDVKTI